MLAKKTFNDPKIRRCFFIKYRGTFVHGTAHLWLRHIHASHMGVKSCLRKATDILFWSQMSQNIKNYVSQCELCNELKPN